MWKNFKEEIKKDKRGLLWESPPALTAEGGFPCGGW